MPSFFPRSRTVWTGSRAALTAGGAGQAAPRLAGGDGLRSWSSNRNGEALSGRSTTVTAMPENMFPRQLRRSPRQGPTSQLHCDSRPCAAGVAKARRRGHAQPASTRRPTGSRSAPALKRRLKDRRAEPHAGRSMPLTVLPRRVRGSRRHRQSSQRRGRHPERLGPGCRDAARSSQHQRLCSAQPHGSFNGLPRETGYRLVEPQLTSFPHPSAEEEAVRSARASRTTLDILPMMRSIQPCRRHKKRFPSIALAAARHRPHAQEITRPDAREKIVDASAGVAILTQIEASKVLGFSRCWYADRFPGVDGLPVESRFPALSPPDSAPTISKACHVSRAFRYRRRRKLVAARSSTPYALLRAVIANAA